MKYWPNQVFAFLLSVTEVNVNLAEMYFSGHQQMGQIDFCKKLAKTLIFNTHYNEDGDKTQERSKNNGILAIVLSHSPSAKNFLTHESLQQTVNICSTNAAHAKKGTYLLSMCPRSLLVCRMYLLSSCLYQKQSFHTRLNSAVEPPPLPKVCECSSISSKQKSSIITLGLF